MAQFLMVYSPKPLGAICRKHSIFFPLPPRGRLFSMSSYGPQIGPIQCASNLLSILPMFMFDCKNALQQFPGWDCRMWPLMLALLCRISCMVHGTQPAEIGNRTNQA